LKIMLYIFDRFSFQLSGKLISCLIFLVILYLTHTPISSLSFIHMDGKYKMVNQN
jgi:hypothetical protein